MRYHVLLFLSLYNVPPVVHALIKGIDHFHLVWVRPKNYP